jgi:hypothetical protein
MSGCGKTSDLYKKQREEARANSAVNSALNSARRTHKTSKRDIWKKPNVRRDPERSKSYIEELENQKPDPSVFY